MKAQIVKIENNILIYEVISGQPQQMVMRFTNLHEAIYCLQTTFELVGYPFTIKKEVYRDIDLNRTPIAITKERYTLA